MNVSLDQIGPHAIPEPITVARGLEKSDCYSWITCLPLEPGNEMVQRHLTTTNDNGGGVDSQRKLLYCYQ